MPYLCHREAGTLPTLNTSKQMARSYTRCTSLKQVQKVLDNYEGRVYRDCSGDGFWIDVDCEEFHCWSRKGIIAFANLLFRERGWTAA